MVRDSSKSPDDRKRSHRRDNRSDSAELQLSAKKLCKSQVDGVLYDAEHKRLEEEMLKRKERIEKWRAERHQQEVDSKEISTSAPIHAPLSVFADKTVESTRNTKDLAVSTNVENQEDDDVDPLDAYMETIAEEVKKNQPIKRFTPKSNDNKINKGDIMEQNMDVLEYENDIMGGGDDLDDLMNFEKKSKADSIVTDHDKIYYRPFKKDFYVEVPEISRMSQKEVAAYRQELDRIKVRGGNVPKPIKKWAQCITYISILDTLKRHGMVSPTPIQAQSLPIISSGRDMLGIAKTGSGKTLAFVLPMLRHVKCQPCLEPEDGPIGLILTPTRELAMQISRECTAQDFQSCLRVAAVYGGTGISEQIAELKRGAEIVVCTPGRMIDMMAANHGKVTNLRRVTYVVLDEADRMFDMGFEPQVTKILDCVRPDRQTVMFSATFPRQMEALARRALTKPVEVVVGGRSVVCGDVEQHVCVLNDDEKYLKLLELLGIYQEQGSVLIFVHRQEHADELMKSLMQQSYLCMSLHGGLKMVVDNSCGRATAAVHHHRLDQYDRDSVISDFKSGNVRLLVATSVAARGLDVKDIILVVNYDCPNHYEDYIHRCGRTGRAGRKGVAYTFLTPSQEKFAGDIIRALEQSYAEVSSELSELWKGYVSRMKAEGVDVKTGGRGFSGRGFRFNEEEDAFADDKKRVQKAMFNLNDSDDDDDDKFDIDKEIDKVFKSTTRVRDDDVTVSDVVAPGTITGVAITASINEKLETAKKMAANIGASIRPTSSQATSGMIGLLKPNNPFDSINVAKLTSKSIAEQIGQKLNNRLNYVKKEGDEAYSSINEKRIYEETLEINDFPQQVRCKITSKDTLSNIAEYAEVGIAIRGKYFAPNKPVPNGEAKLFLTINAYSDRNLQLAKAEIKRLIKEEMMKLQNPALQLVNRGRYKVV